MDNRNDNQSGRGRDENDNRNRQGSGFGGNRQQDQFGREDRQQGGDFVHDSRHANDRTFGDSQSGGWRGGDDASRDRNQSRAFGNRDRDASSSSRSDWGTGSEFPSSFGARDEWTDRSSTSRGGGYGGNQSGYRDYGAAGDYGSRGGSAFSRAGRDYDRSRSGERGFWDKASDEVSSWFGDRDAERRRDDDQHRGKGPKGYSRSDDRIKDDVNDRLTEDGYLDATDIDVEVKDREVTLTGQVSDRQAKRRAEDVAEGVSGVKHVQNNLRVRDPSGMTDKAASTTAGTSAFASATSKPTGAV